MEKEEREKYEIKKKKFNDKLPTPETESNVGRSRNNHYRPANEREHGLSSSKTKHNDDKTNNRTGKLTRQNEQEYKRKLTTIFQLPEHL